MLEIMLKKPRSIKQWELLQETQPQSDTRTHKNHQQHQRKNNKS